MSNGQMLASGRQGREYALRVVFTAKSFPRAGLWLAVVLALGAPPAMASPTACSETSGAEVQAVPKGSALARAGLIAGDRVVGWKGASRDGRLASILDWLWLEIEESPRGQVRLEVKRGDQTFLVTVPASLLEADARPRLPPALGAAYDRPRTPGADPPSVEEVAKLAATTGDACLRWWLFYDAGVRSLGRRELEAARAFFQQAVEASPGPFARGLAWEGIGDADQAANDLDGARAAYREALTAWAEAKPRGLAVARAHDDLANVEWRRGRLDEAEAELLRAFEIREALAPGSLVDAGTRNGLGALALQRGELDVASRAFAEALEIRRSIDPGSLAVAASLNNLGVVARRRGRYDDAERNYLEALAIREAADDPREVAASLTNLGIVAEERGEPELAEARYRRALAIYREREPGSLREAAVWNNLGVAAFARGDLRAAEEAHSKALALREAIAPGSLDLTDSLENLALVLRRKGESVQALTLIRRSLALRVEQAPGSIAVAQSLINLGELVAETGSEREAAEVLRRSLEIVRRVAPGSFQEAVALDGLARLEEASSPDRARELLAEAVAALEVQSGRLGGTPAREAALRKRFRAIYHRHVAALVAAGRPEAAFEALEQYRARSFLATLAQRDLLFPRELPPHLAPRRRRLTARYDELQARIRRLGTRSDEERLAELRLEVAEMAEERRALAAELRDASPRLADLVEPRPLDAARAAAALPADVVLVAYSVGESATQVLALTTGGRVVARAVPLGAVELGRQVEVFRRLVREADPASTRGRRRLEALAGAGRELHSTLLGPVAESISAAERLLLLPDGPLHLLPFAALVTADGSYLAESRTLHFAPSATAYAELRAWAGEDRGPPAVDFVAFADPLATAATSAVPGRPGSALTRLPAARREVAKIADLFPDSAEVYLGARATEERARTASPRARYLHFATHGVVDDRLPLDAGLALAGGGSGEAGLLQSWEILEELRLSAELVVLSGCSTAVGEEAAGEGLLSLARAFHFAGAPAVVASLWQVEDEGSARLMAELYRGLREGLPRDRALARAVRRLLAADAPPAIWATFQLYGDPGASASASSRNRSSASGGSAAAASASATRSR